MIRTPTLRIDQRAMHFRLGEVHMAVNASAANARGNYVASSQPGCHIAHHDAEWIIEATDFDLEDYGLEPGEEEGVPDMIVDPDTRSLRCPKRSKDACAMLGVRNVLSCVIRQCQRVL